MRGIDLEVAFSLNKQSAIGTAITAASIDRVLPYTGFVPVIGEHPDSVSDKDYYGKGHSFATRWNPITKRFVIGSREFDLSNLSALFAPAFVMGALATTNPSSAQPTVYDHKFTFQDPATNEECLYTSFIEKMAGVEQNLVSGAVIEQFTLTGTLKDHVKIAWQGFARDMAANAAEMPALSEESSFFKTLDGTFSFGAVGAAADVSAKLVSWNATFSQNPSAWWLPGNPAGQKNKLSKVKVGKQSLSGQIVVLFEDTVQRTLFRNNTECELTITLVGNQIGSTGLYYTVTIEIPHLKIPSEAFSEEQEQATLTIPFTEQTVLKDSSDDYCSVTVRCTEDDTKLLVAA